MVHGSQTCYAYTVIYIYIYIYIYIIYIYNIYVYIYNIYILIQCRRILDCISFDNCNYQLSHYVVKPFVLLFCAEKVFFGS